MIKLSLPTEDYEIDLPGDVKVTVRPCTMTIYQAALGAARKALLTSVQAGEPTADDENLRQAYVKAAFSAELARYAIKSWTNVLDAGGKDAAPVSPQNVVALISIPAVGSAFLEKYTEQNVMVTAEGNA